MEQFVALLPLRKLRFLQPLGFILLFPLVNEPIVNGIVLFIQLLGIELFYSVVFALVKQLKNQYIFIRMNNTQRTISSFLINPIILFLLYN